MAANQWRNGEIGSALAKMKAKKWRLAESEIMSENSKRRRKRLANGQWPMAYLAGGVSMAGVMAGLAWRQSAYSAAIVMALIIS
jgi:hypothetical protein